MTAQPAQPLHDLDTLVATYLDLAERIEDLTRQQAHVKAQLRDLGVGEHQTSSGITVTVSAPSRRFNRSTALSLLTEEQKALCKDYSDALIKKQLPPVLLDQCMDEGTSDPIVRIK